MRHGISGLQYRPSSFIEITKVEFDDLNVAKAGVITVVGIEEKFDLLIQNYAEFEQELLSLALREALFRENQYNEFRNRERVLTRRFANLLSSARLYVDQIGHALSSLYGRSAQNPDQVAKRRDAESEARLGYRVMEKIRNYVQHRSLPIHPIAYSHVSEEATHLCRTTVIPHLAVEELREDPRFDRTILEELTQLPQPVAVTPLLREYIEGLACVHAFVRSLTAVDVERWERLLRDTQDGANKHFGESARRAVSIVALSDDGTITACQHVFPDFWEYRGVLARRNSALERLAALYVSGISAS